MRHQTQQHAANLALKVDGADLMGVQRCSSEASEAGGILPIRGSIKLPVPGTVLARTSESRPDDATVVMANSLFDEGRDGTPEGLPAPLWPLTPQYSWLSTSLLL